MPTFEQDQETTRTLHGQRIFTILVLMYFAYLEILRELTEAPPRDDLWHTMVCIGLGLLLAISMALRHLEKRQKQRDDGLRQYGSTTEFLASQRKAGRDILGLFTKK